MTYKSKFYYNFITLLFLIFIVQTNFSQWQWVSNTFNNIGVYTVDSLGPYLFAGTTDSGAYRSSNNGVNWVQINNGLTNKKVDCFAELGPYIFCGTYGGVFRSTNFGDNWILIGSSSSQSWLDLLVYQDVIYAARAWGLSKTTNYGLVWVDISTGLPSGADPYCMAIKDSILYTGTNLFGIFKSTNLGANWTAINSDLGSLMIFDIFFKDQYMFVGTGMNGGIYRSSNGGANWQSVNNGYSANMTLTFCGFENYIYVGSGDGGVWRSSNDGANWNFYNDSLSATLIRGLKLINGYLWAASYNYGVWKRLVGYQNPPTQAPNLVAPPNNSTGQSLTPLLDWDSVSNTSSFYIQVSTDNNFNTTVFDNSVAFTQITVPTGILINNTQYFWRVRGVNSAGNGPWSLVWNFTTALSQVINPAPYIKWISGEKDTIRWTGTFWPLVNIKCTLNAGTPQQNIIVIAQNISNSNQSYIWDKPDILLSFRSKITIENASNINEKVESAIFRIKPYLLTRLNSDSTYYEFRKDRDQWGFWNDEEQMWPHSWYQQFNYRGIDPFTNETYSPTQGFYTFFHAKSKQHPDWVSLVNTLTINSCYFRLTNPVLYSLTALNKWKDIKGNWAGSCFGISTSNALVFSNKNEFLQKYPSFTQFENPISVQDNDIVRKVINELFVHQYLPIHGYYASEIGSKLTPNQTLDSIKKMLKSDNALVSTLSLRNNHGKGGHSINVFKLTRNTSQPFIYYVHVYDNQYPTSTIPIIIFTNQNNGNGIWDYENGYYANWGGEKNLFLREPAINYINDVEDKYDNLVDNDDMINDSTLFIYNPSENNIKLKDILGNITGSFNDTVLYNINGSTGIIAEDGHESPPKGFVLPVQKIQLNLNNFIEDTLFLSIENGKRIFTYERFGTIQSQNDKLYFDSSFSVINPDQINKHVNILNLNSSSYSQKLFAIDSFSLTQNDSININNIDSNNIKLISCGSGKNYNLILNYISNNSLGVFEAYNIPLQPNTSHIYLPQWHNIANSQLVILVDVGNNGTIDDTLRLNNQMIGIEQHGKNIPDRYSLSQNYPNPFNPVTTINFDIIHKGIVKLTIFDVLGREITSLVDRELQPGSYKIKWDAFDYPSGVYFYRLEAGDFTASKKMILIK